MSGRRGHLRRLALGVEEQAPGKFIWCLRESTGDAVVFEPVQRAVSNYPSYSSAMAAGYAEWQRLVAAEADNGPRTITEDENADPVGVRVTAGPLMPPGKLSRHKLSSSPVDKSPPEAT
jgi:hypothetical protein